MDVLRTDAYSRADLLLKQLDELWDSDNDYELGTPKDYDREGGGTVSRVLSQEPVLAENKLVGELQIADCLTGDVTLNGTVSLHEVGSSWMALGSNSSILTCVFRNFSLVSADSTETIEGTYEQDNEYLSGIYTLTSATQLYERIQGSNSVSLSDATYVHHFEYSREPDPEAIGGQTVRWPYSEVGNGTLSISELGLSNVSIELDPKLLYINKPEEKMPNYTDVLESGALELKVPAGGQLNAVVASAENHTVLYTLTDSDGQETTIEREWLAPVLSVEGWLENQ